MFTCHSGYMSCMSGVIHNMKMTRKTLKQAIGKQKDKSNFPNTFLINDQRITDKQEIVSNVGKATSQNVPSSIHSDIWTNIYSHNCIKP